MMGEINPRLRRKIAGVISAVALFIILVNVSAYSAQSNPIIISFASPFPINAMSQVQNIISVSWQNTNTKHSYVGHLLFIVNGKSFKIVGTDIQFTFGSLTITPQKSGNSLLYYLPQQTFPASTSGIISIEVTYNKPGTYNWQIGIVKA
jgi:hypothetical protein